MTVKIPKKKIQRIRKEIAEFKKNSSISYHNFVLCPFHNFDPWTSNIDLKLIVSWPKVFKGILSLKEVLKPISFSLSSNLLLLSS